MYTLLLNGAVKQVQTMTTQNKGVWEKKKQKAKINFKN